MLGPLRSLTRLPRHVADGLHATIETAQSLHTLQRVVAQRLGSLDHGLRDVCAALPGVATDLERVRATIEPQYERIAAIERSLIVLPAVAGDLDRVRATVEPQQERVAAIEGSITRLESQLAELGGTLRLLKGDVEDATELIPDPDAPGPLARAKEAIAGAG